MHNYEIHLITNIHMKYYLNTTQLKKKMWSVEKNDFLES